MAVERREPAPVGLTFDESPRAPYLEGMHVEVIPGQDGGVDVIFSEQNEDELEDDGSEGPADFYGNLVSYLDDALLGEIGERVFNRFKADKDARSEYDSTIEKGLDLLGIKLEETSEPFEGACTATHPLIIEAAVKFQSKATQELFPSTGPVKSQILGKTRPELQEKAARVAEYMNYQLTEEMPEFFDDHERMLLYVPVIGSAFKKTYYSGALERPVSDFVPVDRFYVPNMAPDLWRADRYTEVIYKNSDDFEADVAADVYEDLTLTPRAPELSSIATKTNQILGFSPPFGPDDYVYTLLEQHCREKLPDFLVADGNGLAVPVVVTVDHDTHKVLSLRRNWKPTDPKRRKRMFYTHYKFVPGFGFMGLGYIHLLGNMEMTLTAIMRALVDAGQFANLPAGFKAKGVRITGNNSPLSPGEWRDVESTGIDLTKAIIPVPYKEPSEALMRLLPMLTDSAQKFADSADQVIANATNYGPVGTTLALLEASAKFFSSVHKRMHKSQRDEFRNLKDINADCLPDEYPYDVVGGSRMIYAADFDGSVDVLPVSDPNISSSAHRLALANSQLQIALQLPQIHDLRDAASRIYGAMNTQDIDRLLPVPQQATPNDPVTDIQLCVQGKPIRAFPGQNHQAHIAVKQAWMAAPSTQTNQGFGTAIQAINANITEHVLMQWLEEVDGLSNQMSQGTPQPIEVIQALAAGRITQVETMLAQMAQQGGPQNPDQMIAGAEMTKAQTGAMAAVSDARAKTRELDLRAQELAVRAATLDFKRQQMGVRMNTELQRETMRNQTKIAGDLLKKPGVTTG